MLERQRSCGVKWSKGQVEDLRVYHLNGQYSGICGGTSSFEQMSSNPSLA